MKWLLLLSLILNGVLAFKLSQKKEVEVIREEVVEKVIIKKVPSEVVHSNSLVKSPETQPSVNERSRGFDFDEVDMEDAVSDVDRAREDFLVGKLGFTEKEFKDLEVVKNRYYERYQRIVPKDQLGAFSLEQRREILALEEEREAEMARTVGPQRWKEWVDFRDQYNQKMMQKMSRDKGVIVPMEI